MPKNPNRLSVDQVNAGNFTVPKGEEHLYHVKIEVPQFDQSTGQRISIPRIQPFTHKMFKSRLVNTLKQLGYKLEILHDPTEFLAEKKSKAQPMTREERIKAKIIEDLRAQGILKDPNEKTEEQLREEILAELEAKGMLKKAKTNKKTEKPAQEAPEAPVETEKPVPAPETPAEDVTDML